MNAKDFGTKHVSHWIDADAGYRWPAKFNLRLSHDGLVIGLDVKLTGANPGDMRAEWEKGINGIWNDKVFFSDGSKLIPVELDFDFVSSGQNQTVKVHSGSGRADMLNWYVNAGNVGLSDRTASHEVGHMMGAYDEYPGAATHNHYTTHGTLMSDLTIGGFVRYFWLVKDAAEKFAHAHFRVVAAKTGDGGNDTWAGTHGKDGYYGLGGADDLNGGSGRDYIDGGSGDDRLAGGPGKDTLVGDAGNDTFVFDLTAGPADVDRIEDFSVGSDRLELHLGVSVSKLSDDTLSATAFATGKVATHPDDRILYDPGTGSLLFDPDGNQSEAAIKFATIGKHLDIGADQFLIV